jgi:hypothetical protein
MSPKGQSEARPHAFGLWIDCFELQRWFGHDIGAQLSAWPTIAERFRVAIFDGVGAKIALVGWAQTSLANFLQKLIGIFAVIEFLR